MMLPYTYCFALSKAWREAYVPAFMEWTPFNVHFVALLGCDLGYYLAHRMYHMTNIGWASHVMHHSSPDFNYSTALRQGVFEQLYSTWFYLPLAFLGVPMEVHYLHRSINTIMQFWTHTQEIPKLTGILSPIEWISNTPSHHRVHHARNYGRRNFGGMLIIWDRLFGTFEEESYPCIFGLDERKTPLGTHNPVWQQLHHYYDTFRLAKSSGKPVQALFTRMPGEGMVMPAKTDKANGRDFKPENPPCDPRFEAIDVYVISNYILLSLMLTRNVDPYAELTYAERLVSSIWLSASFVMTGLLMDKRSFAFPLKFVRLLFMFGLAEVMFRGVSAQIATAHTVVSMVWLAAFNFRKDAAGQKEKVK